MFFFETSRFPYFGISFIDIRQDFLDWGLAHHKAGTCIRQHKYPSAGTTQRQKAHAYNHTQSGIRNRDPSVRGAYASELAAISMKFRDHMTDSVLSPQTIAWTPDWILKCKKLGRS
jgi:hypothetical protein